MKSILICLTLLALSPVLNAQNLSTPSSVNVFIDCQRWCDQTYLKQEIPYINYMQNHQEANVYVLVTERNTGGSGEEVQLIFVGNEGFTGQRDTIKYFTGGDATEAVEREQLALHLKQGLLPYIIQTPMIEQLTYSIDQEDTTSEEIHDPWNNWVFSIGGNGWLNGEDSYFSIDLTGRLSASKITDKHKFLFNTRYNYDQSTFRLADGDETFITESYNVNLTYVKSINPHWSAGFLTRTGSSTFSNTDLSTNFRGAVEYNIFPYEESSTHRFSFMYSIGPEYYDYTDTTIFDRLTETRVRHGLDIDFNITKKWGNISLDVGAQQYLHDLELFNAYLNPNIDWQIFKGFSVDLGGYASFEGDRINIPKSEISDQDILLQIRQLDTDFSYFAYFGINYRFGSKYNNYVNPRF